jgi:aminoglycoside phosphotransferase family enzyme/predicted kinase
MSSLSLPEEIEPAAGASPPPGELSAAALEDPRCYPHAVDRVELIETHISWIFLAGDYAYKLKKPVNLGFLDFSTLQARRHYCTEELRLNRRTAAELYLDVVPVAGTVDAPRIGAAGPAIDYALKMRRFPQEALADRLAARGELGPARIDAMAAVIAGFHAAIPAAPARSAFGSARSVAAPALRNIDAIEALVSDPEDHERLERLRAWTRSEAARNREAFSTRKRGGCVRECHGDLHLRNIVFLDDRPVPFDCIEFSPELRWIDVMSEVAFLVMDLLDHRLDAAAWRLLNGYLEATGDYAGLRVLRFYLVYRAMVRAKIACIRLGQARSGDGEHVSLQREYRGYLALAESLARTPQTFLILMHGLSGSGKTTVSQGLLERTGAVRVRSDVERKRLHGLAPGARGGSGFQAGLYAPAATRKTYTRLRQLARGIVESGRPALVDAAFLSRRERSAFAALARELRVPLAIVSCSAPESELRRRVQNRLAANKDASEAGMTVLERQLAVQEPLQEDERACLTILDTTDAGALERTLERTLDRIARLLPSAGPDRSSA